MQTLDDQAKEILRTLRPGDHFTLREGTGVFQVKAWVHPVEQEPYVEAYRYEPPWGLTAFRAIRVSRIEAIVPRKDAA